MELIEIDGIGDKVKRSSVPLFDEVVGGSPSDSQQKISANAALNAAPSDVALAKHNEQDDADVQQRNDDGKNIVDVAEGRRRVDAGSHQDESTDDDENDGERR